MDALENLKQTILKDYPRMCARDTFSFECGHHLECFNHCCADVNIFLTPYDVLRMRKAIGLGSAEFLAKYTLVPFDKTQHLPTPLLLMNNTERKECQFVDQELGCTIYENRPWPCRMYPLGVASPGETEGVESKPFYFMMNEEVCKGVGRPHLWTVSEWEEDQKVDDYAEFGELFKAITLHPAIAKGVNITPRQIDMYWIALYDLDTFRDFVFQSSFLDRFDLTADEVEAMKNDDEALLRFGFRWAKMALFGELSVKVRPDATTTRRQSQNRASINV